MGFDGVLIEHPKRRKIKAAMTQKNKVKPLTEGLSSHQPNVSKMPTNANDLQLKLLL